MLRAGWDLPVQNMVEGLCSGVGSVITENIETLPEEVRFPLKTTEELSGQAKRQNDPCFVYLTELTVTL